MARDEFANLPGKEQMLARMIGREVGAVLVAAKREDERVASVIAARCVVCDQREDDETGEIEHLDICPHAVAS